MSVPIHTHVIPPSLLTPSEREVITRLADGMSPQEIAHHRERSLRTVEAQIRNARAKSGARNIYHLTAMFARGELL